MVLDVNIMNCDTNSLILMVWSLNIKYEQGTKEKSKLVIEAQYSALKWPSARIRKQTYSNWCKNKVKLILFRSNLDKSKLANYHREISYAINS